MRLNPNPYRMGAFHSGCFQDSRHEGDVDKGSDRRAPSRERLRWWGSVRLSAPLRAHGRGRQHGGCSHWSQVFSGVRAVCPDLE